jgi:threonine/homoserine/homoserine lactone efflux protein
MLSEFASFFSNLFMIFSFSFLVALTGAMAPGPLLTYTIIKSAKTAKRGYLMGIWIIAGHACV